MSDISPQACYGRGTLRPRCGAYGPAHPSGRHSALIVCGQRAERDRKELEHVHLHRTPRACLCHSSEADACRVARRCARLVRRDRAPARERADERRRRHEQPRVEAGGGADPRELPACADSERDRGRALGSLHGRRPCVPGEGAGARRARGGARRRRGRAELLRLERPVARLEGSPRDDGAARDAKRRGRSARRPREVRERAGRLPGRDHRHADGRRRLREALRRKTCRRASSSSGCRRR